ncbi:hypothetical protein MTR67_046274 [Solanum verrucosum]|uniref:Disease resistance protein At4g27190-like leucine-rich repeats domain-containing protein n=1 Tax=Solanum verrucosum TaxID=315347 RepID=A0AAF0UWQ2_SOLVR|nr:hypothetical protein MTR67_046274 [Solanum verrucosum]
MSPSVARGASNLRILKIGYCESMEEVITEEKEQGEGIMTLFPRLEVLELDRLPQLEHFFLTEHALEFPLLREVKIDDCPEMNTFVQQGIFMSIPSLESVNNDAVDLNKVMFNSKVSCPNLEKLYINRANSITSLLSRQLPIAPDFSKLETLEVENCGKLRNLMNLSVARGVLNLRILKIDGCESMEEVITKEEQQGGGIMTLFPRLEKLNLHKLPKLGHFFLTECTLEFPFLREVKIDNCPEMNTFPQQRISVSCPSLENLSISSADSISSLFSYQLPYFSKLQTLVVENCVKLRNLMSPSMSRCLLNLRTLYIDNCESMEEVITEEEHQGEEMTNEPLFPLLQRLYLRRLPKLGHFFLTKNALKFPFLIQVIIFQCPKMKTFVQQRVYMGTASLNSVNSDDEVKAMFNSKIVISVSHLIPMLTEVTNIGETKKCVFFVGVNCLMVEPLSPLQHFQVSCPNLEVLYISEVESISATCSHQLPTAYFSKLETLEVMSYGKLRNLMSPTVARGLLNLQVLSIEDCESMEEVITKGEGIMTLFPHLEELNLSRLPKLGHFCLAECTLEFLFLIEVIIDDCPEMKTFVQQGVYVGTTSLKSVNSDDEVKVVDLNKAMFNSKVSCPNLKKLYINGANSISALCCHQLPTAYFSKLVKLEVTSCEKLRNLMSPSVARGALNLQILKIGYCQSMEEVITVEEQQGEGTMTLFPLLAELELRRLPKMGHFFLTEHALTFPFLRKMKIDDCPKMKTFVQQGISVSTPILKWVNFAKEVKVDDLNKWTQEMFNSQMFIYVCQLPCTIISIKASLFSAPRNNLKLVKLPMAMNLKLVMTMNLKLPMVMNLKLPSLERVNHDFGVITTKPNLVMAEASDSVYESKAGYEGADLEEAAQLQLFLQQSLILQSLQVSCPNLEMLCISGANSISALCSHQLPTDYFTKLKRLCVRNCGKLRNLMSPSVARGLLKLQVLEIGYCESMEEMTIKEEQQGDEMTNEPLFPLLEELDLRGLPKLEHFFLTKHALEFPFLKKVYIDDCPEMKTFVQQGIYVSTPSLKSVNNDDEVKVDDLNKWTQQRFTSKVCLVPLAVYLINSSALFLSLL